MSNDFIALARTKIASALGRAYFVFLCAVSVALRVSVMAFAQDNFTTEAQRSTEILKSGHEPGAFSIAPLALLS